MCDCTRNTGSDLEVLNLGLFTFVSMSIQNRVLIVAATPLEISATVSWLREQAVSEELNQLTFPGATVTILFTGVGPVATAITLAEYFAANRDTPPTLALQAGIAGALDRSLTLGDVVQVSRECFGDLGATDKDGSFLSLKDIGLPPGPPFGEDELLRLPPYAVRTPFPEAAGVTVNQTTGEADRIAALRARWPRAQVETMEGAPFFLTCLRAGVAPVQLRAISNYVEPRNRSAWRLDLALPALNTAVRSLLTPFLGLK